MQNYFKKKKPMHKSLSLLESDFYLWGAPADLPTHLLELLFVPTATHTEH